eukprot:Protomagalhaensia_sp_Gyna_25__816@NODE_1393_length_1880_cov_171_182510_g1122_i0_p1_GENE_NODE_1393_length_1880_cov_171_182510_g1122_i0NODE_1393_length_1880_cov_171_182510_g1122_i0_p1_ORF_typecomplete_len233_score19_64_NODE_1393_length_1880_cov_171_182510_g1122_i0200898
MCGQCGRAYLPPPSVWTIKQNLNIMASRIRGQYFAPPQWAEGWQELDSTSSFSEYGDQKVGATLDALSLTPAVSLYVKRTGSTLKRQLCFFDPSTGQDKYHSATCSKFRNQVAIVDLHGQKLCWIKKKTAITPTYTIWIANQHVATFLTRIQFPYMNHEITFAPDSLLLGWVLNEVSANVITLRTMSGEIRGQITQKNYDPTKCYVLQLMNADDLILSLAILVCIDRHRSRH